MAYTDPKPMTPGRLWSIVLVVLIHAGILYALVNGGYEYTKKKLQDLKVIDVKEPPPPPEKLPPPPPPDNKLPPPPVVTPPPIVQTQQIQQPQVFSQPTPPPVYAPTPEPPRPTPPAPPPAPPAVASKAQLRSGSISDEDYPPSAVRAEEQGRSLATFTIGTDGRVASCNASGAGPILDAETCKLIIRRFRYKAAQGADGSALAETKTQAILWRLPK